MGGEVGVCVHVGYCGMACELRAKIQCTCMCVCVCV